ncbi:hypothetical protein INR49_000076 [Caranx melampygus]|nr:hypothetical protein INR49_000076 [Caranx melampygus]
MSDSTSPKGNSGPFSKKIQRRLSRGKEKVLQKLGKSVETRDDHFERFHQQFNDQQTDGNRIYKDLRNYIGAVRDMREASRRLSQSLFDVYESDWAGEEDLGAIVEVRGGTSVIIIIIIIIIIIRLSDFTLQHCTGEDLLWNDYEVKLLDQAVRTMESYVSQFPDVREEMTSAKGVYESINSDLKEELPALYDSRVGCYVSVFSAVSSLREIFYKEMRTFSLDLQNVIKELQAQHPDKGFAVRDIQPYGSLRRRTLISPKAWKTSFSEFHRSYNPKGSQRFSFKSPDKPRRETLSREGSSLTVSPSESRDLDAESTRSCTGEEMDEAGTKSGGKSGQVVEEEEKGGKDEASETKPPAESEDKGGKATVSESSSEPTRSCDSESLDVKLSALDNGPLHIEEGEEDNPVALTLPKQTGWRTERFLGLTLRSTRMLLLLLLLLLQTPKAPWSVLNQKAAMNTAMIRTVDPGLSRSAPEGGGRSGGQEVRATGLELCVALFEDLGSLAPVPHRKVWTLSGSRSTGLGVRKCAGNVIVTRTECGVDIEVSRGPTAVSDMEPVTSPPTQANTTTTATATTIQVVTTAVPATADSAVIAVVIVLILVTVAVLGFLLYRYLCHNKGDYRTTGELAPGEDPDEEFTNQEASEKKEYFI